MKRQNTVLLGYIKPNESMCTQMSIGCEMNERQIKNLYLDLFCKDM